ncbi:MAG: hypothetical protein Kow0080_02430 [Candidatus Promineifilaceae bacterium]
MATYSERSSETDMAAPVTDAQSESTPSKRWLVLAMVVFPIHVWAYVNIFREVPAWILRLSIADLLGVIAYTLLFSLLESLLMVALLVVAGVVLKRWIGEKQVAWATAVSFTTAIWFIILHSNAKWLDNRAIIPLAIWGITYLLVLAADIYLIHTKEKITQLVESFAQRLATLSALYLFIDIIGIIYIIIRNV